MIIPHHQTSKRKVHWRRRKLWDQNKSINLKSFINIQKLIRHKMIFKLEIPVKKGSYKITKIRSWICNIKWSRFRNKIFPKISNLAINLAILAISWIKVNKIWLSLRISWIIRIFLGKILWCKQCTKIWLEPIWQQISMLVKWTIAY